MAAAILWQPSMNKSGKRLQRLSAVDDDSSVSTTRSTSEVQISEEWCELTFAAGACAHSHQQNWQGRFVASHPSHYSIMHK